MCCVQDGIVNVQGPNYALAKSIQLWRAILTHSRDSHVVSSNIAPAARSASVVGGKNKNAGTIAAALDGMTHFKPLCVFEPETVSACMAALLVYDLCNSSISLANPLELSSRQAFHGGTFRLGIKPNALGPLFVLYGKLFGAVKLPQP